MHNNNVLIFLVLIAFTFISCEREPDLYIPVPPEGYGNDILFQATYFGNPTISNFYGIIKNQDGERLEGVEIRIGNASTTTDQNGVFVLNNADVFENFAYIRASKIGYINGSRTVIPKSEGKNRIEITMIKSEPNAVILSGEESTVSLSGNSVIFPGDFVDENGNPYTGEVQVVMEYLNPNFWDTFTTMPGSLFGQDFINTAQSLETYGMLLVSLFSPSGATLNIDPNNPATIEFRISSSQSDIAPSSIPLWYFDESVGYWKQDGLAYREGNKYISTVSHFSWWNCDLPLEYVELCFSVNEIIESEENIYFLELRRNETNQIIYSGIVLADEELECGLIPKNEELTARVFSENYNCDNTIIYEDVIGPFSTDSNADFTFDNNEIETTTITGAATNCSGMPITNGYVYIDFDHIFSIDNGIIDIALNHCTDALANIQIYDFDTNSYNIFIDVNLNGGVINLGAFSTCDSGGGIFNGDIDLLSQDEVNEFGQFGYIAINGDLTIGSFNEPNDISDLSALTSIEQISGGLFIYNTLLEDLNGINSLTSVNQLRIGSNELLQSLDGLDNLENVEQNLFIENNSVLTSLIGIEGVTNTGVLRISSSPLLTSLEGLNSFSSLSSLEISSCENLNSISEMNNLVSLDKIVLRNLPLLSSISISSSLTSVDNIELTQIPLLNSISDLSNLTAIDRIELAYLPLLNSLEGLEQISSLLFLRLSHLNTLNDLSELNNLTSIGLLNIAGNESLTSLNGLDNVLNNTGMIIGEDIQADVLVIAPNPELIDYCALENLFTNGTFIEFQTGPLPFDGVHISFNAYNPSVQDIINGDCSQ